MRCDGKAETKDKTGEKTDVRDQELGPTYKVFYHAKLQVEMLN